MFVRKKLYIVAIFLLLTVVTSGVSKAGRYRTNIELSERKSFKYYIGFVERGTMACKLVAGRNNDGSVKRDFIKNDILDENNYFVDGIYEIGKDGEIYEYDTNESLKSSELDLSGYSNVIYVNAAIGDDSNIGDMGNPLKTISKAYEKMLDGGAIILAEEIYNVASMNFTKDTNFIGKGKNTVLTTNNAAMGWIGNETDISFSKLVLRDFDNGSRALNSFNSATFNNILFDGVSNINNSGSVIIKLDHCAIDDNDGKGYIFGDVATSSEITNTVLKSRLMYNLSGWSSSSSTTLTWNTCIWNAAAQVQTGNTAGTSSTGCIATENITFDDDYKLVQPAGLWEGSGIDGTHIGLYGGEFSW